VFANAVHVICDRLVGYWQSQYQDWIELHFLLTPFLAISYGDQRSAVLGALEAEAKGGT
jgi:hypothetical protein